MIVLDSEGLRVLVPIGDSLFEAIGLCDLVLVGDLLFDVVGDCDLVLDGLCVWSQSVFVFRNASDFVKFFVS